MKRKESRKKAIRNRNFGTSVKEVMEWVEIDCV
jgi:hypothetical protein